MEDKNKLTEEIMPIIGNSIVSVSKNVEQNCIITTEDKLHLIFDEYNNAKKQSSNALAWLGILITLIIADFTCSFRSIWFLDDATVRAVFYLSTFIVFCLFFRSGITYLKNKKKLSFSYFISKIKGI